MKTLRVIIIGLCVVGYGIFILFNYSRVSYKESQTAFQAPESPLSDVVPWHDMVETKDRYGEGVNDALQCITLLSLELRMGGQRKTWGDMGDIVRKRLGVDEEQ
jgi:hypothetical protein